MATHTTFNNLSTKQREIVRYICKEQLSSLRRIYNNEHYTEDDLTMLLIENEIPREVWEETLEESLSKFKEVLAKPHGMHKLEQKDLSIFRHILANCEEHYKKDNPADVSDLWNRLFLIEDLHNKVNSPSFISLN